MRGTESPRTHPPTVKLATSFCYLCILFTKGKIYNIQWDRKWSCGVSHFPTLVCISELLQDLSDASIGSEAMLSSVALCSSLSFFGNALQINALYIMQHLICIYNKYFPSFLPDLGLSPMNSFTLWLESILPRLTPEVSPVQHHLCHEYHSLNIFTYSFPWWPIFPVWYCHGQKQMSC